MGFLGKCKSLKLYISFRLRGVPPEVLAKAGPGFECGWGAFFRPGEDIRIGSNVFIGRNVHIAAPCVIKDYVLVGSNVAFVGGDHRFDFPSVLLRESGRGEIKPIVVEEDVWIGHGCVILCGTHIGQGSIIGAGSVVTKDIPPCTVWGGAPAIFLKERFRSEHDKNVHLLYLKDRMTWPPETDSQVMLE